MSRTIFGISTALLGDAILSLRQKKGYSQERLARELGCSTGAVRRWESGLRRPNLLAVQKMRELCPDEESRQAFDLESGTPNPKSAPRGETESTLEQDDRLRQLSDAIEGLNQVYQAAEAGHAAADELLRDLADKLTTRGGDWRTMRYARSEAVVSDRRKAREGK